MNISKHPLWETYNSWNNANIKKIEKEGLTLVPKKILEHPSDDPQRGLNLISFLDSKTNHKIEINIIKPILLELNNQWVIPAKSRHITIFDMLPHNSGIPEADVEKKAEEYKKSVQRVLDNKSPIIKINFSGIFLSPDGIFLQGFPVNNDLQNFRDLLRIEFVESKLENFERKKYVIKSAHVALLKFFDEVNQKILLELSNKLREGKIIPYQCSSLVLNISSRYDKNETIKIVKRWKLTK